MLEAINLTCERDDRCLFEGLSFTLQAGDLLRVEGPNGSGKTTLLRSLCQLIPIRHGEITWRGEPVSEHLSAFHQDLLYMGHRSVVKPGLTALENLRFLTELHQTCAEDELWRALECVGLRGYEEVYCRNLSAGQQRRVGLAQLYLSQAAIWVLDEIFTAIDKTGVAQFEQLLSERAQAGGIVVFTTHHAMAVEGMKVLQLGGERAR